jgi:radical SAM protein with 4Fe4S-binding SPASM domain
MQSNVRTCPHVDDSFISGHLTDLENVVLKNVDFNRYETHCNSCEVFRLCKSNCPIEVPDEVFYSNCKNEKVWYREIQFAAFNIMFNSEVIKIES